jgi:hypothetical protein
MGTNYTTDSTMALMLASGSTAEGVPHETAASTRLREALKA